MTIKTWEQRKLDHIAEVGYNDNGDDYFMADEIAELWAELAALKNQEPVAWRVWVGSRGDGLEHAYSEDGDGAALFLAAGAQPIPDGFTVTPLEEQQMFDDWCPYKGNPDPRVVWSAAVDAVNAMLEAAKDKP